ncbi:amidohydrolase family protein [Alteribacter natronophilus]|uniref:amidohydrolase family protein n=1 Tax=Alteribacter natronophilus TaxID=2583810 RepID=UPI00110EE3DD|nr:amidohydrolase family protein [Alteribacter natronophilus]TMW70721.1 amidohydrolase family protein [Alteribacter natronophilus]
MKTADLMITGAHLLTMEGKGVGYIPDGAIAITGSTIAAAGPTSEITRHFTAHRTIDGTGKIVMPGFIDAHMHTGLTLIRGVAQDMNDWMQKGIWPFARHLTTEDKKLGSMVNIIEGLQAGTTTFGDYNDHMPTLAENYERIGARAVVTEMVNEMPETIAELEVGDLYPFDTAVGEEKRQRNVELLEKYPFREKGRIVALSGPQGPDMMSLELLKDMQNLAEEHGTKLHMHVAQGDREIGQMEKRYGKRSIPFLEEHGFLNDRLLAVHLTEAKDEETATVAKSGAGLIYCAGSIGIIDGLVPPMLTFLENGGRACLGSDQAPGNNCNQMFNEMKMAALLNKVKRKSPTVFNATLALRSATIEGARVLGLENEIGSLSPGKKADVIVIDGEQPSLFPVLTDPIRNIVPNLVYSARGHEVEMSIIDGTIVMEDRQIQTVDAKEAVQKAQKAADDLSVRAADDLKKADSDILEMVREGML